LNQLKDGRITTYTTKEGLANNAVGSFYEDREGNLWISTESGLSRFRDGKFTTYTTKEGLFSDTVYSILEDGRGNLWMGCNKGIFRVNKQELNDLAEGKIKSLTSIAYDESDGLKSTQCLANSLIP